MKKGVKAMGLNLNKMATAIIIVVAALAAPAQTSTNTFDVGEIRIDQNSFKAGKYLLVSFPVTNARVIEFTSNYIVKADVTNNAYTVEVKDGLARWTLKRGLRAQDAGRITFPLTIRVPYDQSTLDFSVRAISASGEVRTRPRTVNVEGAVVAHVARQTSNQPVMREGGTSGTSLGSDTKHIWVETRNRGNQELAKLPTGATTTHYTGSIQGLFPLDGFSLLAGVQVGGTKDLSYHPSSPAEDGQTIITPYGGVRFTEKWGILDLALGGNLKHDWKFHKSPWQLRLVYERRVWSSPSPWGGYILTTSDSLKNLGVVGSLDYRLTDAIALSLNHFEQWDFTNGETDGVSGLGVKVRPLLLFGLKDQVDWVELNLGLGIKANKDNEENPFAPTLQGGVSARF
ncbi:MAG: hypothetical protein Q7R79_03295 [bacterium]|nr:hypothetical protein [bacterium]